MAHLFKKVINIKAIRKLSSNNQKMVADHLDEIKKSPFHLIAFRKNEYESIGYWREDLTKIIDLKPISQGLGFNEDSNFDLYSLLNNQKLLLDLITKAQKSDKNLICEHEIDQLPILSKFSKIIGVARNFKNPKSAENVPPNHPIIFAKPSNTISGPSEATRLPHEPLKSVIEAEIAVIIGKKAKDISVEHADSVIFGYTVINDITDKSEFFDCDKYALTHGKYMDGYLPCSSRILINKDFDYRNKKIESYKNGVLIQQQSSGDMFFDIPTLISKISSIITLEPGDCILSGTPVYLVPVEDVYIKSGDLIHVEIEDLGSLTTLILSKDQK